VEDFAYKGYDFMDDEYRMYQEMLNSSPNAFPSHETVFEHLVHRSQGHNAQANTDPTRRET
jgi:hypothetical protein